MKTDKLFVQSEEQLKQTQREVVKKTLQKVLPKILRASNTKKFLTTKDLKEDYGIGYELQNTTGTKDFLVFLRRAVRYGMKHLSSSGSSGSGEYQQKSKARGVAPPPAYKL